MGILIAKGIKNEKNKKYCSVREKLVAKMTWYSKEPILV